MKSDSDDTMKSLYVLSPEKALSCEFSSYTQTYSTNYNFADVYRLILCKARIQLRIQKHKSIDKNCIYQYVFCNIFNTEICKVQYHNTRFIIWTKV